MTVRDLYAWAEANDALDLDVEIQHRDSGGFYYGCDDLETPTIERRSHDWNTQLVVNL